MKNKIYFISADIIWPVGNAGAIIVAKNPKAAVKLADGEGLHNAAKPKQIGVTNMKAQVIFSNNTEY